MGRKRNADTGLKGDDPTCPQEHVLKRLTADGEFSCDACDGDISQGCCFYGCEPCDYSLCGGCYVKLATNTMEDGMVLKDEDIDKRIEAEVTDLCEHYELDFRIAQKLTEALLKRKDTYENDIYGLWCSLKIGKKDQVSGLAMKKVHLMNDNKYVYVKPPKELFKMIEKYKLDDDAANKLTDLLAKRPDTVDNDIVEVEKRLEGCKNPSSLVMKIIIAIDRGQELPKAFDRRPPPQQKIPESRNNNNSYRDSQRSYRDRSRSRDNRGSNRGPDRSYDRHHDRSDRGRDDRARDDRQPQRYSDRDNRDQGYVNGRGRDRDRGDRDYSRAPPPRSENPYLDDRASSRGQTPSDR